MSRVGKKILTIPSGVEVTANGRTVSVKGAKGQLSEQLPPRIAMKVEGSQITFEPETSQRQLSASWGTASALVRNMIEGVTKGYSINLKLIGVGYRAGVQGSKLNLALGYSHPVEVAIPQGITVDVKDQTEITVSGISKQAVGQFASEVRGKRAPEPFKGKGVRYTNEYIAMKEGKKK